MHPRYAIPAIGLATACTAPSIDGKWELRETTGDEGLVVWPVIYDDVTGAMELELDEDLRGELTSTLTYLDDGVPYVYEHSYAASAVRRAKGRYDIAVEGGLALQCGVVKDTLDCYVPDHDFETMFFERDR